MKAVPGFQRQRRWGPQPSNGPRNEDNPGNAHRCGIQPHRGCGQDTPESPASSGHRHTRPHRRSGREWNCPWHSRIAHRPGSQTSTGADVAARSSPARSRLILPIAPAAGSDPSTHPPCHQVAHHIAAPDLRPIHALGAPPPAEAKRGNVVHQIIGRPHAIEQVSDIRVIVVDRFVHRHPMKREGSHPMKASGANRHAKQCSQGIPSPNRAKEPTRPGGLRPSSPHDPACLLSARSADPSATVSPHASRE
jgi:hypothetical protein